jgi:mono/diheme cytochrome c family protein
MNTRISTTIAATLVVALASGTAKADDFPGVGVATASFGEAPVITSHLDQADIDAGRISLNALRERGEQLFAARFNRLDGQGRPGSTGSGAPRGLGQPAFIRTSAPDANSCAGCHNQPAVGGAGDFVANVFVLAQTLDPVTESTNGAHSNERNTLGMHGAGPIEMLAREMSADLIAIRDAAMTTARQQGAPVTRPLTAKGVSFGAVTALPDGRVDPSAIVGVDWDLVVKPFHQKGAVVSLREFSNNAMNHHHGMQSTERFGDFIDADLDGIANELTTGDMTAVAVFQASLPTPGQRLPTEPTRRLAVLFGERLFGSTGCGGCHVPALPLASRLFSEPNPYNPPGNLRPTQGVRPFAWDMTSQGPQPRLERDVHGAIVRAFTDLKRHNLCDADYAFYCNEQVTQGNFAGFAPASSFTVPPRPRPTAEFLTRKLWDVGNTDPYGHRGDLTTITDAIYYHGGEARAARDAFFALPDGSRAAIIEFLKSLQVL